MTGSGSLGGGFPDSFEELRELLEQFEVFFIDAIWLEMHDVVTDFANRAETTCEVIAIDRYAEPSSLWRASCSLLRTATWVVSLSTGRAAAPGSGLSSRVREARSLSTSCPHHPSRRG